MTHVLVIDDELDICVMVSTHLQKLDFKVDYAISIKEALAKISRQEYEILFIDIDLVDGSGFDVISYLRKRESKAKIIVISAYHNELSKAMEMGADAFVAKPFSVKNINGALKTLNLLAL